MPNDEREKSPKSDRYGTRASLRVGDRKRKFDSRDVCIKDRERMDETKVGKWQYHAISLEA